MIPIKVAKNMRQSIKVKDEPQADRFNKGKLQWNLVHFKSIEPLVRVLEFGEKKYDAFNWMKPMDTNQILNSAQRHLAAMIDGEDFDEESKFEHAGHVLCNMMFYIYHKNKNNNNEKKTTSK